MTDYDDFKNLGGGTAAAKGGFMLPGTVPAKQGEHNSLTVGSRSDGQISILSAPNVPGKVESVNLVFPRETAVWLAREILRIAGVPAQSESEGSE